VGKLKTAKGYEEWLKRAEEIASKRKRQGRNFECQYEWVDSEEILR
jgi:disulfide oxidoreductase YuzD